MSKCSTATAAARYAEGMADAGSHALSLANAREVEAAFDAAPADVIAEIIDGSVSLLPRPRPRHARAALRVARQLGPFDDDPQGWVLLLEPELHLGPGPDKVVPDVAGWRRTRMPEVPDDAAISVAPDWVCEVLSERTERETLEVYELERARHALVDKYEGSARVRAAPFASLELDLAALWAR